MIPLCLFAFITCFEGSTTILTFEDSLGLMVVFMTMAYYKGYNTQQEQQEKKIHQAESGGIQV